MKKFIASENAQVIVTTRFKNSIEFAVEATHNERQLPSSRMNKSFVGMIVTFNPVNNEVESFKFYDYIDNANLSEVDRALQVKLSYISSDEEYKHNQFITVIKACDFEYYGFEGYADAQEQALRTMKLEHKAMSIYIDIVTKINVDETSIEEMNFSARTVNCLKRAGINTVQQIKNLSQIEVMKIRNLGMNSYNELQDKLNIKFI